VPEGNTDQHAQRFELAKPRYSLILVKPIGPCGVEGVVSGDGSRSAGKVLNRVAGSV
jgi:hypothetical protein